MIGVKGMEPGTANHAMDKTKILLRLEATVVKVGGGGVVSKKVAGNKMAKLSEEIVVLQDHTCERTDITELNLTDD
jgi:hypothetical protein